MTQANPGSTLTTGQVAQDEPSPSVGRPARGCNSMVEYLPSKQATWVRFPSPALPRPGDAGRPSRTSWGRSGAERREREDDGQLAAVAQLVERVLGKDEVLGSNPSGSFRVSG